MLDALVTVATGLAAVYVIFALITSHVVEVISTVLNRRGTLLYEGILALLGETGRRSDAATLTAYFYRHPLVANLGVPGERKPSYIPARTFTLTLIGTLRDRVPLAGPGGTPRPVPIGATPDQLLSDLRDRVAELDAAEPLAQSLRFLIEGTPQRYDFVLHALDDWFDVQMDRVSGAYRRWASAWQAGIALVIVLAANADTVGIVQQLSTPRIASAVVAASRTAPAQGAVEQARALGAAGLQLGWSALPHGVGDGLAKVGGLALTWFAVLLGAPFWFDLLKQIVPVRITGAVPGSGSPRTARDAQVNVRS